MTNPEPDVLDVAVLGELRASVQDDATFVGELIEAYLVDGAAHIEAIGAAVDAGDAVALVRPAHTLKSSSATLGAARIARTARELEILGRSGSLGAEAGNLVALLREEWPTATDALRVWAGQDGAG